MANVNLSAHLIQELVQLEGRAKITSPPAHTDFPTVERVKKLPKENWQIDYKTPDEDFPGALLVTQQKVSEDDHYAYIYRQYETLPGPYIDTFQPDKYGVVVRTRRQRVLVGTPPDQTGTATLSDVVVGLTTVVAERTTVQMVGADGNLLAAGLIVTLPVRTDEEWGVQIFTDSFPAAIDYNLPPTFTADNLPAYGQWYQPNTRRTAYTTTPYNPPRYVIGARKVGQDGPNPRVEIDYCRTPSTHTRKVKVGYRFPGIFDFDDSLVIPAPYAGNYPPPWPIGKNNPGGFDYLAPRQSTHTGLEVITFSLGKRDDLPPEFFVRSPGAGSKLFGQWIREETIHPKIYYSEILAAAGILQLVENFPASTPSRYNPNDILVASAEESLWRGEIYMQRVILISESRSLNAFPNPSTAGFYDAVKDFAVAAAPVGIMSAAASRRFYATTTNTVTGGTETIAVLLYGTDAQTGAAGIVETVSAVPSGAAASNTSSRNITEIRLPAAAVADTVNVFPAVDPDTATLLVAAFPADGNTLTVGLAGSARTYTFKTTLTGAADQIKIPSTSLQQLASNIVAALRATTFAGASFTAATTPNAVLRGQIDANPRLVNLYSISATMNTASVGWSLSTTGSWASTTAFIQGSNSPAIASFAPGQTIAYNRRVLSNPVLLDSGANNDTQAAATLPSAYFIPTEPLAVPSLKQLTLYYNATGAQGIRVWWIDLGSVTAGYSFSIASGSTFLNTLTPALPTDFPPDVLSFDVLVAGSVVNFLLKDPTHLSRFWPYAGGTYTAMLNGFPHRLPNAGAGALKSAPIGTVTGQIMMVFGNVDPLMDRAVAAQVRYPRTPDDA